jgi:CheY-like chemotaxis protein
MAVAAMNLGVSESPAATSLETRASEGGPQAVATEALDAVIIPPAAQLGEPEASQDPGAVGAPASLDPSSGDFAEAFFNHAPGHIQSLRAQLETVMQTPDEDIRGEAVGALYVGIHLMAAEAERAKLDSVFRLASALQNLLKKLLERPGYSTASSLSAAASAIELLDDLCVPGMKPDLDNPPMRFLVVDDDPVARRALSGSLQATFGRPESAESGEAALALAGEKQFDLIFMDVRMPGMDGFKCCSKIHETAANSKTPVVFVTSHGDLESRAEAIMAGGSGFIPKPVLSSEIRLMALTFSLRGRVDSLDQKPALEEAAC